jgi:hypothetical protein
MDKITVSLTSQNDIEREIKLNNGDLVFKYIEGQISNVYLVTSFRNNENGSCYHTKSYCSLIDLENGYIKFTEPCSRCTTVHRILNHLYDDLVSVSTYRNIDLVIIKKDDYKLHIDAQIRK